MLISNLQAVAAVKKIPMLAFYALGTNATGVVAARRSRQTKQLFAILSPLPLRGRCQLRTQPTPTRSPALFILPFVLKKTKLIRVCFYAEGLQTGSGQRAHREAGATGSMSVCIVSTPCAKEQTENPPFFSPQTDSLKTSKTLLG